MTTESTLDLGPPMTLWRLELARLLRTSSAPLVFGVYVTFAVIGPISARYLAEIIQFAGQGLLVAEVPEPRPVDGIAQFLGNTSQLGTLGVVVVAASALTGHARPEVTAFLRARVDRPARLVVAPFVVTSAAGSAALVLGTAVAALLTVAIIGPLPTGPLATGTLLGALFIVFCVAVVAAVGAWSANLPVTVFAAIGLILILPILGLLEPVQPWLPSELALAVVPLIEGVGVGEYLRSTVVTIVATVGLVGLAMWRAPRREL